MGFSQSFQSDYIDDLIKHQILSSIYLENGIRLKGYLISHNESSVFVKIGFSQVIYKHRINTIIPEVLSRGFNEKLWLLT